jgi:hypothetical protein
MLMIAGLVLVGVGILAFMFFWRAPFGAPLGAVIVVVGTGLQAYDAWAKLPTQCRSWAGAMTCLQPVAPDVKGKRR